MRESKSMGLINEEQQKRFMKMKPRLQMPYTDDHVTEE